MSSDFLPKIIISWIVWFAFLGMIFVFRFADDIWKALNLRLDRVEWKELGKEFCLTLFWSLVIGILMAVNQPDVPNYRDEEEEYYGPRANGA